MGLPWSRCPREPSPEQTLGAPGAGPQVPRRLSAPHVVVEECEQGWREAELGEGRGEAGFSPITWTGGSPGAGARGAGGWFPPRNPMRLRLPGCPS